MLYEHYIDYTSETSNDMTFLESIEHMRRTHTDSVERLTDENLYCNEDPHCNFSPNVAIVEANNSNDCDLELLVNPQTGLPSYDLSNEYSENASHPFANSPSASVPDTIPISSPSFSSSNNSLAERPKAQPTEENKIEQIKLIKINNSVNHLSSISQLSLPGTVVTQTSNINSNKVVVIHLSAPTQTSTNKSAIKKNDLKLSLSQSDPKHEKPPFSYSCLITMALKNSETGFLPVSEIYNYIVEKFPYFKTAPDGWKNSIRHNLSLNKCFQKIETPAMNGSTRKACLWGLNRSKITRLNEEIAKWVKKNSSGMAADIINQAFSCENNLKFEDITDEDGLLTFVDEPQNENIFNFTTYSPAIPISTVTLPLSDGNFYQNPNPKADSKKVWRFIKVDLPSNIKQENNSSLKYIKMEPSVNEESKYVRLNGNDFSDQQLSPEDTLFATSSNAWDDLQDSIELNQMGKVLLTGLDNCHYRVLSSSNSNLNFKIIQANDLVIR